MKRGQSVNIPLSLIDYRPFFISFKYLLTKNFNRQIFYLKEKYLRIRSSQSGFTISFRSCQYLQKERHAQVLLFYTKWSFDRVIHRSVQPLTHSVNHLEISLALSCGWSSYSMIIQSICIYKFFFFDKVELNCNYNYCIFLFILALTTSKVIDCLLKAPLKFVLHACTYSKLKFSFYILHI